ncbi:hypothetical protein GGI12_004820, partial [Dipsacomyces acuminosporus]
YYCCNSDLSEWHRRYSRLRNKKFDEYIWNAFKDALRDKGWQVDLWDVSSLSEARPFGARNESSTCASNHVRSEMIEVENQLLFNALCN